LNALGIVAKDQQMADGYVISAKPDYLRADGCFYLLLIFGYEPLGMSLCRLRGRLFMQRLNMKKRPDSSTVYYNKRRKFHIRPQPGRWLLTPET
jgi:hypothetical protein